MKSLLRHVIFGHLAQKSVAKAIRRAGKELQLPQREIVTNFQYDVQRIRQHHRTLACDAPALGHLEFCSAVLAAYRQLLPAFNNDKDKTIGYLGDQLVATFNSLALRVMLSLVLFSCRNNPDRLRDIFCWLMQQYGSSFAWQAPHDHAYGNCRFQVSIQRCFFVEFFKAHELRELTTVLCRIDSLWYEMIDPKRHGFSFDKAGYCSQGLGAKTCEFPIVQINRVIS